MFLMDHLETGATDGHSIFIYDLTTPFDISTMDVTNRTIVDTTGLGDDLLFEMVTKILNLVMMEKNYLYSLQVVRHNFII